MAKYLVVGLNSFSTVSDGTSFTCPEHIQLCHDGAMNVQLTLTHLVCNGLLRNVTRAW